MARIIGHLSLLKRVRMNWVILKRKKNIGIKWHLPPLYLSSSHSPIMMHFVGISINKVLPRRHLFSNQRNSISLDTKVPPFLMVTRHKTSTPIGELHSGHTLISGAD